jgi:chemotaxis family two-component system sensor kinase Cph1
MTVDPVKFGEADLTSCDREQIHIPGSIQPHGVLLVFDRRSLNIVQYAGDTAFLLGISPAKMLTLTLNNLLDDQVTRRCRRSTLAT